MLFGFNPECCSTSPESPGYGGLMLIRLDNSTPRRPHRTYCTHRLRMLNSVETHQQQQLVETRGRGRWAKTVAEGPADAIGRDGNVGHGRTRCTLLRRELA